jgi:hypothetical protein
VEHHLPSGYGHDEARELMPTGPGYGAQISRCAALGRSRPLSCTSTLKTGPNGRLRLNKGVKHLL